MEKEFFHSSLNPFSKKTLRHTIAAFGMLALFGSGCASVFSVKSDPPQADVSYLDPKTGEKKSLGKTPFEMKSSALKETVGEGVSAGEYFTVLVSAKGYVTEKFSIPASRFGTLVTKLDAKLKPGTDEKEIRMAKEVLDHLFLAQKFAFSKEFDRAQVELDKVINEFPEFGRALSMRASIYFVQQKYDESLKWYEKALKADPGLEDAVRMTAKINQMKGRAPASVKK
jgi:tetratricopeptide (TPR) repeat protein